MKRIVAVDTETTGLSPYGTFEELGHYPDRPFAFSFTHYDGNDFYIRFDVDPFTRRVIYDANPSAFATLRDFFRDETITKVFHNAAFDLTMLSFAGLECRGPFYDTRILAHLADSSRHSFALKPLTKAIFDYPDDDLKVLKDSVKAARRKGKKLGWKLAADVEADYALGDPELCKKYALGDTQRTMKLFKFYEPLLSLGPFVEKDCPYENYEDIVHMEHALVPIVMEMSRTGVALDPEKVKALREYYEGCITKAKAEMAALGFPDLNPKSVPQKIDVFYNKLKLPKVWRKRKQKDGSRKETLSCDKKVLDKWSKTVPLAKCLVELSEAQHQLNSFIIPFQENSFDEKGQRVLRPSFNTCGPITGRLSCSNPNLQNITASTSPGRKSDVEFRARECFVPRHGYVWILADYSQVEIWDVAFQSKDELMIDTLKKGLSIHDVTCDSLFGGNWDFSTNRPMYRKKAKIVNFSMVYGSGPGALSELLGVSYQEAKDYWNAYWKTYKGIAKFNDDLKKRVAENGWVLDFFGRAYFPKMPHKAMNYMVQGSAAGILKRAMIASYRYLKKVCAEAKLLLSIHDELIFEVPEKALNAELVRGIKTAMAGDFHKLLDMPHAFEIEASMTRTNWAEKGKIEEEDLMVLDMREEEDEEKEAA
jgi:DNA polymerase-1